MAVLAYLCKRSGMSLDRLADPTIPAIQLHGTLHLERGRVCRIARNSDEDEPFLIRSNSIIDYLSAGKGSMTVEDFLGRGRLVCDSPVEDGCVGHHPDCGFGHPFPEYDILIVDMRFDFLLRLNVENL